MKLKRNKIYEFLSYVTIINNRIELNILLYFISIMVLRVGNRGYKGC